MSERLLPAGSKSLARAASADEELGRLSRQLDLAFRETAERVPVNSAVTIITTPNGPDLSVERMEKIDKPPSLVAAPRGERCAPSQARSA
jgi:hypothetical protein